MAQTMRKGLCLSPAYGVVKKNLVYAQKLKELIAELDRMQQKEQPAYNTFIPPPFRAPMSPDEAEDLCHRWVNKGAPPVYLICASYVALVGNGDFDVAARSGESSAAGAAPSSSSKRSKGSGEDI